MKLNTGAEVPDRCWDYIMSFRENEPEKFNSVTLFRRLPDHPRELTAWQFWDLWGAITEIERYYKSKTIKP